MANFPTFVKAAKNDLTRMDAEVPTTPEDEAHRQETNLREWTKSYNDPNTNTPKQKQILLDNLKNNPQDFPKDAAQRANVAEDDTMAFHILGRDKGAQPAASDEMQFHILGRERLNEKLAPENPAFAPSATERSSTPEGAVTGRTMVPATRNDIRGAGSPDQGAAFRVAAETGGSFLGGSLGALMGGAGGTVVRPGPGTTAAAGVGLRVGEAAGAFGGSYLSELFDPTPDPLAEASKAAGLTLGTGLFTQGAAGIARKLIGKPHEAGQALLGVMQAKNQVPLPGAVLESEFIRQSQSFGSAAYGTNELLKQAQTRMEGITTDTIREYVSGFQRFHDSAKTLFADIDKALATPLPGSAPHTMGVPGASITMNLPTPGARFFLKGDEKARDAVQNVAENWVRQSGRADAMPSGLQKMYAWAQSGGTAPKFTFEETQQVYDALYNKARALDRAAKNHDVTELAGTNTAAYVREQAKRVKNAFDDQLDAAINSKLIDPDTKVKLVAARNNWSQWLQGQELERLVSASTKDLAGNGPIKGSKLLNQLDALMREDAKIGGRPTLDKGVTDNIRRYALAARAVEDSGKAGAFSLVGRFGQLAGISGMLGGSFFGSGTAAGVGGLAFIGPHIIAATFANQKASALLIRGLRVEPGTAASMRLGRELISIWEKEGLIGPDYNEGPQEPVGGHPSKKVPD